MLFVQFQFANWTTQRKQRHSLWKHLARQSPRVNSSKFHSIYCRKAHEARDQHPNNSDKLRAIHRMNAIRIDWLKYYKVWQCWQANTWMRFLLHAITVNQRIFDSKWANPEAVSSGHIKLIYISCSSPRIDLWEYLHRALERNAIHVHVGSSWQKSVKLIEPSEYLTTKCEQLRLLFASSEVRGQNNYV